MQPLVYTTNLLLAILPPRLCSLSGVRSSSVRSSPRHLSKWSRALVPAALVQVVARPRPRGTCPSGRAPSSPRHLSKWSHALVPAALVQVVARPRPRDTCPSGCTPSSPRHLSKWSHVFVPAHLSKWPLAPLLVFGTHLYGDASPALTRTVTYHQRSLVRRSITGAHSLSSD
jgi:hypothetical protein